jgi:hypothetical protein
MSSPATAPTRPQLEPDGSWFKMEVAREALRYPAFCPGCTSPDANTLVKHNSAENPAKSLWPTWLYWKMKVPFCSRCAMGVRLRRIAGWISIGIAFAISYWVGEEYELADFAAFLIFLPFAAPGFIVLKLYASPIRFGGWDEQKIEISCKSRDYAEQLAALNQSV